MDYLKREEFTSLHIRLRQATDSLHTQAQKVYEMARKLEELTKDTTIRYATLKGEGGGEGGLRAGYGPTPSIGGDG